MNDFLKMQEAANYLGVHKNTLNNWIRQKKFVSFYFDKDTNYRFFRKKDLDKFLSSKRVNNNDSESCQTSCIEQE